MGDAPFYTSPSFDILFTPRVYAQPMQIGSLSQPHKAPCAGVKTPSAPEASSVEPLDTFETAQGVGSAVTYKLLKLKAKLLRKLSSGLSDQPKVKMSKPLVCVQGFRSKPGGFAPLLEHLTADGRNGGRAYYVKGGQFFLDPECRSPLEPGFKDKDARIFRVIPNDRFQNFETCADQLQTEMKAIQEFTGEAKPDVLAHSMGGLSVRRYLDKYPVKIGKLMMLGTPHLGTKNADFARKVIAHNVGWALSLGGLSVAAGPAVEALRAVGSEENANPFLDCLNSRWSEQEKKTDGAITLGGAGYETPTHDPDGFGEGDALVESSSLHLPGANVKILPGPKLHHTLPTDPDFFQEMVSHFGWENVS